GCFPVNLADRVIRTIFPELMELPALTTARPRTDPQPGNLIVLGQQTKTGDRCKIRIHPHLGLKRNAVLDFPQPPLGSLPQLQASKDRRTTSQGPHPVAELAKLARTQHHLS